MGDKQGIGEILNKIEDLKKDNVRIYGNRKADILFITGCTSSKSEVGGIISAYCRYTGAASKQMLSFFKDNCASLDRDRFLDLYVLSAGYGLIPADGKIQNYNVTFAKRTSHQKEKMAEKLNLNPNFQNILNQGYRLIILRLGNDYVQALNSVAPAGGYKIPEGTKVCYLKPKSTQEILLQGAAFPIKVCASNLRKYGNNISYQDGIWSDFLKMHQMDSVEKISKSITGKIEDLLK